MFKVKKSQAISNYRYKYKTGIYRLVEYCFFYEIHWLHLKLKINELFHKDEEACSMSII